MKSELLDFIFKISYKTLLVKIKFLRTPSFTFENK